MSNSPPVAPLVEFGFVSDTHNLTFSNCIMQLLRLSATVNKTLRNGSSRAISKEIAKLVTDQQSKARCLFPKSTGKQGFAPKRGTFNKKTVLRNAVISAVARDPTISPRDFMLGLMRNSDLPLVDRFAAAQAALPLVHPRFATGRVKEPTSDEYSYDGAENNVGETAASTPRVTQTLERGDGIVSGTEVDLSPLDFFLQVMRDPNTPFSLRAKAARIAGPFVHPRPLARKPALVIDDPYGFVIDPLPAKELRNAHRRLEYLTDNRYE